MIGLDRHARLLLVILVITLIVVGPRRLPEMAAQIARAMREFRRYTSGLRREVSEALEDLEKEYSEIQEDDPDTASAWDVAGVNAVQCGYEHLETAYQAYPTKI